MRRILLVLSVATLMVAMMVATAAPAFAVGGGHSGWNPKGTAYHSAEGGTPVPGSGEGGGQAFTTHENPRHGTQTSLATSGAQICNPGTIDPNPITNTCVGSLE